LIDVAFRWNLEFFPAGIKPGILQRLVVLVPLCRRLDMSNRGKVIEKPRVAAESRVRFPRMKSPDFIIIAMFLHTTQLRVWDCSTARVDNSTTNPLCISCGILLSSPSVVLGRQSCRSGSPGLYVVLPRWLTVILPETPNHFVGYPGYPLLLG